MAFHRTYEEFLKEMKAVERVRELVDDDDMLTVLLPICYKLTLTKANDMSKGDDEKALKWWMRIMAHQYFDNHFAWSDAARLLKNDEEGVWTDPIHLLFNALKKACIALEGEVHRDMEAVTREWNRHKARYV